MKKHFVIAASAATIGLASLGAGVAHAATSSNTTKTDPMSNLVDAIATKFNVNRGGVQQVFDTQKAQNRADREAQIKADVAKLVSDGKITQIQADLINAKRAELETQREANKASFDTMTGTERKTAMDKQRTDLETWAKQNNIATQYLRYVMAGGHGHGAHGGHFGDRNRTSSSVTSSSTSQ